jgi:hypothetical protein
MVQHEQADNNTQVRLARNLVGTPAQPDFPPRLTVILPGSTETPSEYKALMRTALRKGHYVIGLSYPTRPRAGYHCKEQPAACFEEVRTEVLTGQDTSEHVSIGTSDSIEGRLKALTAHLAVRYRSEDWTSFFRDGTVTWSQVGVVGHGDGGGYALMLAQRHELHRVVLLSENHDIVRDSSPAQLAPWLQQPFATPTTSIYALSHTADARHARRVEAWSKLGLTELGDVVDVDGTKPPFSDSHTLTTTAQPAKKDSEVQATATDVAVARKGKDAALESAWAYLLE